MPTRKLISCTCLLVLAIAGCGGSSEATQETTPAAAAGDPSTPQTSGAETVLPPDPPAPESTPAEPAANVAPEPQMPQYGVLVVHKVKNYDAWKTGFDGGVQARKDAGMSGHSLMRGAADPNLVAIWAPIGDVEKAKAFYGDKARKDQMKQAGVQGKPEVRYSSVVETQMDPKKQGLAGALLTAKVKDFDAFKTAFDARTDARSAAGIVGFGLSRDTTDQNVTYVYLQSDDPAKLKTYVEAKETKHAWKEAGVVGQAKVTLVQETETVMYP